MPLRIAVNVSALQFQQPAFIDAVACTLKETGLNPNYLELEITENSVISDVEESIRTLQKLREMNVAISIDDFGTGYSSLSYLKRFPIDSLKIDQSFIRDLMADGGDAAIVKAVISLAHNIGVKVVAEGVESQESYHFLKQEQCDEVQGYLFSRPVPAERFEEILRDNHSFIRVGDVPSK